MMKRKARGSDSQQVAKRGRRSPGSATRGGTPDQPQTPFPIEVSSILESQPRRLTSGYGMEQYPQLTILRQPIPNIQTTTMSPARTNIFIGGAVPRGSLSFASNIDEMFLDNERRHVPSASTTASSSSLHNGTTSADTSNASDFYEDWEPPSITSAFSTSTVHNTRPRRAASASTTTVSAKPKAKVKPKPKAKHTRKQTLKLPVPKKESTLLCTEVVVLSSDDEKDDDNSVGVGVGGGAETTDTAIDIGVKNETTPDDELNDRTSDNEQVEPVEEEVEEHGLCPECGCLIMEEGESIAHHACGETLCTMCGKMLINRDEFTEHIIICTGIPSPSPPKVSPKYEDEDEESNIDPVDEIIASPSPSNGEAEAETEPVVSTLATPSHSVTRRSSRKSSRAKSQAAMNATNTTVSPSETPSGPPPHQTERKSGKNRRSLLKSQAPMDVTATETTSPSETPSDLPPPPRQTKRKSRKNRRSLSRKSSTTKSQAPMDLPTNETVSPSTNEATATPASETSSGQPPPSPETDENKGGTNRHSSSGKSSGTKSPAPVDVVAIETVPPSTNETISPTETPSDLPPPQTPRRSGRNRRETSSSVKYDSVKTKANCSTSIEDNSTVNNVELGTSLDESSTDTEERDSYIEMEKSGRKFRVKKVTGKATTVFSCPVCTAVFTEENLMWDHIVSEHCSNATHNCDKCSSSFSRPMDLHRHTIENHPPTPGKRRTRGSKRVSP